MSDNRCMVIVSAGGDRKARGRGVFESAELWRGADAQHDYVMSIWAVPSQNSPARLDSVAAG